NSELQFLPTSEGFYDYIKNQYIYQYKDHLGNTRVSFGKNSAGVLEIVDANDYYPFGMNHLKSGNSFFGSSSYKNYKYNGKELQESGMYDYGARFYMPDIGRWGVVDMKAEKYNSMSPYNYTANNPIIFIDPDGKDLIVTTFGDQQRVFDIFKNIIQNDFGNNVTVNIDKSGLVSFVLAEGAVLSGVQQRLYDAYSMLLAPGSKTTISLTEKSSKTLIGGFDISLGDDGKKYQNTVDLWDVQHAATENNLASTDIFHEAYESFLAQNVPEVASLSQDNAYDVVHPMAVTKGDEIQGVKSGENKDGNINTKTMSFTNYQNFTDKNGNQMHRVVVYQNGNVVSSKEKKGNINLNEIQ
ncbi:RHS repeat domain-containing protein, partial [Chryseobacterium gambrini]